MKLLLFTEKEREEGEASFKRGEVRSMVFSGGTYQVEVVEGENTLWPFLQMDSEGRILDCFCTCSDRGHCSHLAAAYFAILKDSRNPLHERFINSFWNQLCCIASKHHGYRADTLTKGKRWEARLINNKVVFSIQASNEEGKKKLEEIIEDRPIETEETSLKFSNLTEEEIRLWKSGKPTEMLQYELSFWSDLAKWFLSLQEEGKAYTLEFFPKKEMPKWVRITWDCLTCGFYIGKLDWPMLLPSLKTVQSPLSLYEIEDKAIKAIEYDKTEAKFILRFIEERSQETTFDTSIDLGDWKFIPGKGFLSKKLDPIFAVQEIKSADVEIFLNKYTDLLKRYLKDKVHEGIYPLQYELHFDEKSSLHVQMYLFSSGDLSVQGSAILGRWVYLLDKGFFYVQPPLFSSSNITIEREKVGDFIKRHKVWLNGIEGFCIHLANIESVVSYELDQESNLLFSSHIDIAEEEKGVIDLDEWIFLPLRGFFPKKKEGEIIAVWAGKRVLKKDIPFFVRAHKKELECIPHFMSTSSPVEKVFLKVLLSKEGISVKPIFSLFPFYEGKGVLFFGEYTYVKGEGFAKISCLPVLMEQYLEEKVLSEKEELFFHTHSKEWQPWIVEMDPRLRTPLYMELQLSDMQREEDENSHQWKMDLSYKTDIGLVSVQTLWQSIMEGKKHIFSEAGLIDLTSERFHWLRLTSKKKWIGKEKKLQIGALEWIRLQSSEIITLAPGDGEKAELTKKTFTDFQSCEGFRPLSMEGLKSSLRGYQETGVRWLWFLYCYGLSGILCDEMGLGKTHQAMALLAAAFNEKSAKKRFLVVCPTSVIYHWQELLKQYLPALQVYVFYGQNRQADKLEDSYDVLLTSYGMVRSERKRLEEIPFTIGIYDELQQAKNSRSQIHKALRSLQVKMAVGLTGTPIENKITDIKALFDLVLPHYLPSDAYFKEHFVMPIEKEGDICKKQLLGKMIRPFVLRRKKTEVLLELPEKVEEIAYCDLSAEQKILYSEVFSLSQKGIRQEIEKESSASVGVHIFALFSKLKQICDHPCLVEGEVERYHEHSSGKWDLFVELLQEARESHQKVVVFTQYLRMMDIIKIYLKSQDVGYAEIRGSTRDRGSQLKKFKEDPECEVFIASLQAAGVGIDLTAASVVIHYDRWWNPAKENQATDRVHRMGQSRGVQVFKLVTKKTIEERIHAVILQKMGLLDEVVGFDDQFLIKHFTKQELLSLFSSLEEDFAP